jgi:hypothetical protein
LDHLRAYNKPHGCSTSGALATGKALEEEEEEPTARVITIAKSAKITVKFSPVVNAVLTEFHLSTSKVATYPGYICANKHFLRTPYSVR